MNRNTFARRVLLWALNLAIVGGAALAVSPALQSAYGWWSQRQLRAQWDASAATPRTMPQSPEAREPAPAKPRASGAQRGASSGVSNASAVTMRAQEPELGVRAERKARPWPSTRLRIEEIGVDAIVVQGLDEKALARGPGHDPRSAAPGEPGNCVLAGHRNVYGSWFYKLDQLPAGSVIEVSAGGRTWRYSVIGVQTVAESNTSVLQDPPGSGAILTLITCTIPHSPFRLVATAYLLSE